MIVQTTRFGEVDCSDEEVIVFAGGIPGFKQYTKYMLVKVEESPFDYLQSLEDAALAFIIAEPFAFFPNYEFELPEQLQVEMNLEDSKNIQVFNIVNVKGDLVTATINLAAPVIINMQDRTGMQFILSDASYSIHQPLFAAALAAGGE
ncbi:flagellar assembly protein FliW [Paenibacillus radicis (ex Gao et al. 2016)]|uniref:Flagellar assembly factor FliW n=1 Tax=Paenibacillus radicis (ex Gao et al. 2016) TaxID=1737354 RepID=A0A917HMZ3_9BACL|nr:flagellar assembly protein FliW [Paenibacillus radicis (ex Gao et al. 2016)]GGG84442.1 flagellar assembly factor FliW [Paenibacillus radicis (ex Gao et al. 2016)]